MCHCDKYDVKHASKQCNLDRLKSGSKRDTNETPTCAVPVYAPQPNALWRGEEGGTTKDILYTLPRRVGVGCLRVLMEWVEWMWKVALSLANTEARPSIRRLSVCVALFYRTDIGESMNGPGVSSRASQESTYPRMKIAVAPPHPDPPSQPGVAGCSPFTLTTSLVIPIPSSSSSNQPSN